MSSSLSHQHRACTPPSTGHPVHSALFGWILVVAVIGSSCVTVEVVAPTSEDGGGEEDAQVTIDLGPVDSGDDGIDPGDAGADAPTDTGQDDSSPDVVGDVGRDGEPSDADSGDVPPSDSGNDAADSQVDMSPPRLGGSAIWLSGGGGSFRAGDVRVTLVVGSPQPMSRERNAESGLRLGAPIVIRP